jgi:hypothetical protein
MPERRMTEIVRERNRLGQILIQAKLASNRASDLRDLERMRQARAVMVAFVGQKDLCLVSQTPERGRMQHTVAIPLKRASRRAVGFGMKPAA